MDEETGGHTSALEKDWRRVSTVTPQVPADSMVTFKSNSSSKRGKEDVYTLDFVSGT